MNRDKSKNNIWLYAIALFSGVMLILLATAYMQKNINKNTGELENQKQLFQTEAQKNSEAIKNLNEENNRIKTQLDQSIKASDDKDKLINDSQQKIQSYEALLKAQDLYNTNKRKECADILKNNVNVQLLNQESLDIYNYLKSKTINYF